MKRLLSPLKRIIFLSFILFTIFAGEGSGCGCGNESKSSPSNSTNSSQGSSGGGQLGSSGSFKRGNTNSLRKGTGTNFSKNLSQPLSQGNENQSTNFQGNLSSLQTITPQKNSPKEVEGLNLNSPSNNPFLGDGLGSGRSFDKFSSIENWIDGVFNKWKRDNEGGELQLSEDQLEFLKNENRDRKDFIIGILKDMMNLVDENIGIIPDKEIYKFYIDLFNQVKKERYEDNQASFIKNVMDEMDAIYQEEEEDQAQDTLSTIEQLVNKLGDKIENFVSAQNTGKVPLELPSAMYAMYTTEICDSPPSYDLLDPIENWIYNVFAEWKWVNGDGQGGELQLSEDQLEFLKNESRDRKDFIIGILKDMMNLADKNIGIIFDKGIYKFYIDLFNQVKKERYEDNPLSFIKNVMDEMDAIYQEEEEDQAQGTLLTIEQLVNKLGDKIEKFVFSDKRVEEWMRDIWECELDSKFLEEPNLVLLQDIKEKFFIKKILADMKKCNLFEKDSKPYNFYVMLFKQVEKVWHQSNQTSAINDIINIINTMLPKGAQISEDLPNINELVERLRANHNSNIKFIF